MVPFVEVNPKGGKMSTIDAVRAKVQRILTQHGRVEVDKDGNFILRGGSAVLWISVDKGFGDDGTLVQFRCPLIRNVKLVPSVYEWVATEGQYFNIGSCSVFKADGESVGSIWFRYSIIGDDIDESEVMAGTYATLSTCDDLDNMLKSKFGGELIGNED